MVRTLLLLSATAAAARRVGTATAAAAAMVLLLMLSCRAAAAASRSPRISGIAIPRGGRAAAAIDGVAGDGWGHSGSRRLRSRICT